jgi:hypothetical protein
MTTLDNVTDSLKTAQLLLVFIIDATEKAIVDSRESGRYPKDFTFDVKVNTEECYEIYINGTKSEGSEYQLTVWKKLPVIKAEILRKSSDTNGWLVNLEALGFARLTLTDDNDTAKRWQESGQLRSEIAMSIENAIKSFTDQN